MKQPVRDGVIPNESDLSMSSSTRVLIKAGLCLALAGTAASGARAEDGTTYLKVSLDHARILKLDRPVSKVIIGNDQIADATVADTRTIVLTGRTFGTTNLVLLDAQGNAIVDEKLLVTLDETDTVRVYRQTDRKVLFCATSCEPMNTDGSGGGSSTTAAATPG
jgi:Flp pilus assembly secretin CpaC